MNPSNQIETYCDKLQQFRNLTCPPEDLAGRLSNLNAKYAGNLCQ
jgi:hypothetical protein